MLQSIPRYDEKQLFALVAEGDEAAFTEIFKRWDKRIFAFTFKMIKSEHQAEEITQEIFIKLWEKRHQLAGIDNPEAWMIRAAANHTLDRIKKHLSEDRMLQRLAAILAERTEQRSASADERLLLHQSEKLVQDAISSLPERQQQLYRLSRVEGLSYDEIAAQLSISRFTVRNQVQAALASVKEYLEKNGGLQALLLALTMELLKK